MGGVVQLQLAQPGQTSYAGQLRCQLLPIVPVKGLDCCVDGNMVRLCQVQLRDSLCPQQQVMTLLRAVQGSIQSVHHDSGGLAAVTLFSVMSCIGSTEGLIYTFCLVKYQGITA